MSVLITIIAFIVIFSILVLIHEWGHFYMARRNGIKVEEFGLGLPPRAKTLFKDKQGTIYSLNWIPFGGFVRMYGEDATDPKLVNDKKSFISKTKWQRTQVICAGVAMNFLLGIVLLTAVFTVGSEPFILSKQDLLEQIQKGVVVTKDAVLIQDVAQDSAAERAGITVGALVTGINGKIITGSEDIIVYNRQYKGADATYTLLITEDPLKPYQTEKIVTVHIPQDGKIGITIPDMPVIESIQKVRYPLPQAFAVAVKETGRLSVTTAVMFTDVLRRIVSQFQVSDNVAGPVGIAQMTHDVSQKGIMAILKFMALLSVSLATINILPLPALDGGRFLFIIVEFIRGKRANQKWEATIHGIGFALLMLLIAVITYKDIMRIFFG